ncbi:hypothetical protein C8J57DRAFT_136916 [Mycena rebaudengoi]|nr:hypothetical protein C8J57DRAFT_136916 [Mycena rebaudengoi]
MPPLPQETTTIPTAHTHPNVIVNANANTPRSCALPHAHGAPHGLRHRLSRAFARRAERMTTACPKTVKGSKHSNTAVGNPLPDLPAEIWILILEYSTYPCSPCSSSSPTTPTPSLELPSSFLSPALTPASLSPRLAHYRKSMRHKRNLALVSKSFNAYAQPVLYSFVWISRSVQAKALALTLLCQACCLSPSSTPATSTSAGRFIRRLHIETSSLERCNPADLRTILDYAPGLEVYSDYRSVRRGFAEARCAPEQLFAALAQGGGLRRLSWTNYDDPALVGLGLGLGMRGVGAGLRLEYLELNFVSSAVGLSATTAECGAMGPGSGLVLPELRTLKLTLDNATFAVLSTWEMPALRNLSVVSADFSYASEGFSRFFHVHGRGLRQLELGHSSSSIEEHYLTAPPQPATPPPQNNPHGASQTQQQLISATTHEINPHALGAWCPNLEEFICSADAEWNWQNPDWIAPHLLLPTHPNVSFIGIRGVDKRLWDDYALANGADDGNGNGVGDGAAFFGLREQMETLLRREAFPRLRYVRDMSEGSDLMRRGAVGLGEGGVGCATGDLRVVRFWEGVLRRCKDEGVWLEDWRGWNVTAGSLRRARMGLSSATSE